VKDFFSKRIISEMLNIQLQNSGLNYQTDTKYIQTTYIHINFKQILNTQILILVRIYLFLCYFYTLFLLFYYF